MHTNQLLYLSQADVAAVGVTMADVIEVLEVAFHEKGEGRVEMPPKPGIHPGGVDNFIHAMPAYIPALASAGLKWVSGFPKNQQRGLPYITGLVILNDPETGKAQIMVKGRGRGYRFKGETFDDLYAAQRYVADRIAQVDEEKKEGG